MALYVPVHIVCDRCGTLIGAIERKLQYQIEPLNREDYPADACVLDKEGTGVYCLKCADKHGESLDLPKRREEEDICTDI